MKKTLFKTHSKDGREVFNDPNPNGIYFSLYKLTNLGHDLLENNNKVILKAVKKGGFDFVIGVLKAGGIAAVTQYVL